jgi:hypothetical protein
MRIEFLFERNTVFLSGFSSVRDAHQIRAGISGACSGSECTDIL